MDINGHEHVERICPRMTRIDANRRDKNAELHFRVNSRD
jgi:hypothetical protein